MITLTREEAQQVLDWFDSNGENIFYVGGWGAVERMNKVAETIRARLSAPEPELVAKIVGTSDHEGRVRWCQPQRVELDTLLYTAPPQREWQGLTEKETIDLALNAFALPEFSLGTRLRIHQELVSAMNEPDSRLMIFAATIEQALREKNGNL